MKYGVSVLGCILVLALAGESLASEPAAFPGMDTLRYCTINSNNTGWSGSGLLFGFGVKFMPASYPAVVTGAYYRAFTNFSNLAQFRIVDDDSSGGAPGTTLSSLDTTFLSYQNTFTYYELPACTIPEGSFYLFILSRYDGTYGGNWLHDGDGLAAPPGVHWRHSAGTYTLWEPPNDLQICAVVDYLTGTAEEPGRILPGGFVLGPNPAVPGIVRLELGGVEAGRARVTVTDASGRVVVARSLERGSGRGPARFDLDLTMLRSGVYLVRVDASGRSWNSKLVVQN